MVRQLRHVCFLIPRFQDVSAKNHLPGRWGVNRMTALDPAGVVFGRETPPIVGTSVA